MFDFEHKLQTLNRGYAGLVMRWNSNTFTSPVTGAVISSAVTGGRYTRFATFNPRGPDEWTQRKVSTFDTRFEHRFNRHLSFRLNGQHYSGNYARWGWGTTAGGSSIPSYRMESGLLPGRIPAHQDHDTRVFAGQADLLATFKIGPTSHKLLLTMDASDSRGENPDWTMSAENLAALPDSVRNLNVYRPDWSGFDRSLVTELIWDNSTHTKNIGFILSERMELLRGRVLLYASLRHDDFYSRYENHLVSAETGSLSKNMFNETYGGVAHIIPGKLIVFANRSSSFTASTTVDLGTGELQDPITGRGIEAGVRGEVLKEAGARHALYWSASIYRIDRRVPQLNPDYADEEDEIVAGTPQYLNSGIERVDGVELELFGNITKQFFLSLSYTKLDAHVKDYPEEPAREGVPLQYAPETCITSTARYKVTEGRLRGLTVGLTMRYNGEYIARYGTAGSQITGNDSITGNLRLNYGPITSIEVIGPAVTLFDAFAEYEFRTGKYRHTIGMNIKNLNDTVWYNRTGTLNPGRQIHLRYRLRF